MGRLRQRLERLENLNQSGPVTSVSLAMPSGFSVAGSPVTGSGGFTVSYLGQLPATSMPALTGVVTTSAGSTATSMATHAVNNSNLAQMNALTLKGNNTNAATDPLDLTPDLVAAMLASNAPVLLSATTGIDAKATGKTTLYTPSGFTALVTMAIVQCTAATAITVGPTVSIGTGITPTNIYPSTALSGLTSSALAYNFPAPGVFSQVASGTAISINVSAAATGTSQTLAVYLFGILR